MIRRRSFSNLPPRVMTPSATTTRRHPNGMSHG